MLTFQVFRDAEVFSGSAAEIAHGSEARALVEQERNQLLFRIAKALETLAEIAPELLPR